METLEESHPVVQVESGELAGVRFPIDKAVVTLGRLEDNDIVINDPLVSKHHARFVRQGHTCFIEDLASSNGTFVNGQRVASQLLSSGDVLYLGDTTLTFWADEEVAEKGPAQEKRRKQGKGVALAVAGAAAGLLILGAIGVVLFFLLGSEKDNVKPEVRITSPPENFVLDLRLPVNSINNVPVKVTASDNRGLDRIVVYVNDREEKTLKAVSATKGKEAAGGAVKTEDFEFDYGISREGDYVIRVRVYDWKGNMAESEARHVKAREGQEILVCRDYVAKVDGYITEFVTYRQKFQRAYRGAKNGEISYAEAGYVFNEVGNQRRDLLARLNATPPPAPFAGAHSLFAQQISYAIQADDLAVLWARDMMAWEIEGAYYGYEPDPNGYEKKMQAASAACQKAAARFKAEYNAQRASQLNAPPGPDPTA